MCLRGCLLGKWLSIFGLLRNNEILRVSCQILKSNSFAQKNNPNFRLIGILDFFVKQKKIRKSRIIGYLDYFIFADELDYSSIISYFINPIHLQNKIIQTDYSGISIFFASQKKSKIPITNRKRGPANNGTRLRDNIM